MAEESQSRPAPREPPDAGPKAVSRRGFLKTVSAALGAVIGALLAWPMIGSIIGTVFRLPKAASARIARLSDLPQGRPVQVKFEMPRTEEFLHGVLLQDVWVIRHSDSRVTVFSPICPHLGCRYNWFPAASKFICPCHGSVFSITGKVEAGPAPRGLDPLPYKIDNGDLYVNWELFEVGIPQRIRVG